jgi:elongin-A
MPADTLQKMAQRMAGRCAANITSVGDMPLKLVRPIILKIRNPDQLHMLEQSSPQIIGHIDDCWLAIMNHNIPGYSKKPHRPSDPKNWYKVYRKLKKEADAKAAADAERLKAMYDTINQAKQDNMAKMTTRPKMPVTKRPAWGGRQSWAPSSKNLPVGDRLRKDAQDSQRAKMLRERNQLKLGRQANIPASQTYTKVAVPPRSMVEEIKLKNMSPPPPAKARPAVRAPTRSVQARPPMHAPKEERRRPIGAGNEYDIIRDREARLKALQSGAKVEKRNEGDQKPPASDQEASGLTLDFLEEEDLVFGDKLEGRGGSIQGKRDGLSPPPVPAARVCSPAPFSTNARPTTAKRKAPPTLFMASPAKKGRTTGK